MTVNISSKFRKSNEIVNHRDFDKFEKKNKRRTGQSQGCYLFDPSPGSDFEKAIFFLTFV